jgi:hypothetical protein
MGSIPIGIKCKGQKIIHLAELVDAIDLKSIIPWDVLVQVQ